MEPEGLSPHWQDPTTCSYSEPDLLLQNLRMVEQIPRENDSRSSGQEITQPVMNSDL
jgi:hypothetical protein